MYFVGCVSIYLMSAISFERFYINFKPHSSKSQRENISIILIILSILIGLFWSCVPITGWSYYSLESARTSCSVEWNDRSINVTSYNISMFIFAYLVPLLIILISYSKLFILV